jgi:tRNA pseudouridine38-40 synthase
MEEPKRIALALRYDGAHYHGWQMQDAMLPTVQLYVQRALSRVANHPVVVTCAGRTDAGVHAACQVIHFDTTAERTDYSWVFGANSNLPADISVLWAKPVPQDFHARFSATARRYRYIIFNHDVRPGILRHAVGWFHKKLDVKRMQAAANYLVGEHDFSGYRGSGCQSKSPIRDVMEFKIMRQRRMVILEIKANAFLLHMVRNIAGVLIEIGCGEKEPEWAKEILDCRDRTQGGVTIIPNGLYLVEINYPEKFDLPRMPVGPFFLPYL